MLSYTPKDNKNSSLRHVNSDWMSIVLYFISREFFFLPGIVRMCRYHYNHSLWLQLSSLVWMCLYLSNIYTTTNLKETSQETILWKLQYTHKISIYILLHSLLPIPTFNNLHLNVSGDS